MRIRSLAQRIVLLFLLLGLAASGIAQSELPKSMKGSWSGLSERGNVPLNGTLSVVIDKQNADGSIEGRMGGSSNQCEMKDEPMTGRFDGSVLTLQATWRPLVPQATYCSKATYVLKKTGSGFEGGIPGSRLQIKASLAPF
jgi:hypothetical protein